MTAKAGKRRKAVLLVNTRSLQGAAWLADAKEKLLAQDLDVTVAQGFNKAPELFARVKAEATKGKLIIVGGGDGTMSATANILVGTNCTMGVLPLGTGNAFARDLQIPTDLDKAIDIIVNGEEADVDLGMCGDKYFVNVLTIGLTATVAKTLTVPLKRRFGRFVYGIALMKALKKMKPFHVKIETLEGGVKELEAIQIVVGNGHFHAGPLPLSPTAAITSGHLRLYAVEADTKFSLVKYALLLPTGMHGMLKTVYTQDTTEGTITTTPIQSVVVDGEMSEKTPVKFSVAPQALKVMVPKSFRG